MWVPEDPGFSPDSAMHLLCDPRQARHLASLGLPVIICKWKETAPPGTPHIAMVGSTQQSRRERLWKEFLPAGASLKGLWLPKQVTWALQLPGVGRQWHQVSVDEMFVE